MQVFGGWVRGSGSGGFVYTASLALSQIYGWCEWFVNLSFSSLRGIVIAVLPCPLLVRDSHSGGAFPASFVSLSHILYGGEVLSSLSSDAVTVTPLRRRDVSYCDVWVFSFSSTLLSSSIGNASLTSYIDGKAAPKFDFVLLRNEKLGRTK